METEIMFLDHGQVLIGNMVVEKVGVGEITHNKMQGGNLYLIILSQLDLTLTMSTNHHRQLKVGTLLLRIGIDMVWEVTICNHDLFTIYNLFIFDYIFRLHL